MTLFTIMRVYLYFPTVCRCGKEFYAFLDITKERQDKLGRHINIQVRSYVISAAAVTYY